MVSVFIPTYNSSRHIGSTIESLLSQTFRDIEILCVDDGSTDQTVEVLQEYSRKDGRVKFFCKKNQGSVPFSWNYIFPYLNGEYTLYMSHDDLLEPDTIELLVYEGGSCEEIDCVIPQVVFFSEDLNNPESEYAQMNKNYCNLRHGVISGVEAFNLMLDYTIPGFALWKTSLIKKIGMPTASFNSDEFAQRLWVKNCRKVAFSNAKFGYRQTPHSIVRGFKPSHIFSLDTNLKLFNEALSCDNVSECRLRELQLKYYQALLYLNSKYRKVKDAFSEEDRKRIDAVIVASYDAYRENLHVPLSVKGVIIKLSAIYRVIFNIMVFAR